MNNVSNSPELAEEEGRKVWREEKRHAGDSGMWKLSRYFYEDSEERTDEREVARDISVLKGGRDCYISDSFIPGVEKKKSQEVVRFLSID